MKVSYFPEILTTKKTTLILGSFESIHLGHMRLIKEAQKFKKPISIMIVENPTLLPKANTISLQSLDIRLMIMRILKINFVSVVKFDDKIKSMDGREFVDQIVKATNAEKIIVGKDFKAGFGAKYTSKELAKDFSTTIVDFVKFNNIKISSTKIHELLMMGQFKTIGEIMPFPFMELLKFDNNKYVTNWTADKIHSGIYACSVIVNTIRYWALIHVNQQGKIKASIPDLLISNIPFEGIVEWHNQARIIVSSKLDHITNDDRKQVAEYLKNIKLKY